ARRSPRCPPTRSPASSLRCPPTRRSISGSTTSRGSLPNDAARRSIVTEVRGGHVDAHLAGRTAGPAGVCHVACAEPVFPVAIGRAADLGRLFRAVPGAGARAVAARARRVDDGRAALPGRAREAAPLAVARVGRRVDAGAVAATLGRGGAALLRVAHGERAID